MTIAASATACATAIGNAGAALIARRKAAGEFDGPAYTKPIAVAFSPSPIFDASKSNVFWLGAVTNNVPGMSIINGFDGQSILIRFAMDAVGGWAITMPGNCKVSGAPVTTANAVNLLSLSFNAAANAGAGEWEGSWVATS